MWLALHEAAHAVTFWAQTARAPRSVSVDDASGRFGYCMCPRMRRELGEILVTTVAGYVYNHFSEGAQGVRGFMADYAGIWPGTPAGEGEDFAEAHEQARRIVMQTNGRATERQITAAVKKAAQRAEAILAEHRPLVNRIAGVLAERGKLNARELRRMIRQKGGTR